MLFEAQLISSWLHVTQCTWVHCCSHHALSPDAVMIQYLYHGCYLQAGISSLVWVEHSNGKPSAATLNTITAAKGLGGDVTALVAGASVQNAADKVAGIVGITKVRGVQAPAVPCQQCMCVCGWEGGGRGACPHRPPSA
jgi:hypothetical protein